MTHPMIYLVPSDQHSHLWDVLPSLLGAVVGGGISTITSFLVAKRTQGELLAREVEDRSRRERAVSQSAWLKLKDIADRLHTLHNQVCNMLGAQADRIAPSELWKRLLPLAGVLNSPIVFSAEEIALVFKAGLPEVANNLILIASRGAADDAIIIEYSNRRHLFAEFLVTHNLGQEAEGERMAPIRGELEQMAPQIRAFLRSDRQMALNLLGSYSAGMRSYFADPQAFQFHPNAE